MLLLQVWSSRFQRFPIQLHEFPSHFGCRMVSRRAAGCLCLVCYRIEWPTYTVQHKDCYTVSNKNKRLRMFDQSYAHTGRSSETWEPIWLLSFVRVDEGFGNFALPPKSWTLTSFAYCIRFEKIRLKENVLTSSLVMPWYYQQNDVLEQLERVAEWSREKFANRAMMKTRECVCSRNIFCVSRAASKLYVKLKYYCHNKYSASLILSLWAYCFPLCL